ncbi:AI-2E family transporter [Oceanicella actignis]|uniref:Predicted PurR-regulated permease PerM n=1 Tax=Oceanicella actignis TaxID=1189325 RepID=A0A1M7S115_9RHOB|nr:Predicted PurR-regulated permease PerM [Oceanicella actignis]SHN52085.1 Predicted PurR-regulated permease PerM [Oceanicella actignis]
MALSAAQQAKWWLGGLAATVAAAWALSDVLTPFLAGAALAYFLDPVADRLEARGLSRALATALITLFMALAFVAAMLVLIPAIADQARKLVEAMPAYAEALRAWIQTSRPELLAEGGVLQEGFDAFRRNLNEWSVSALKSVWSGGVALIDFVMLLLVTPVVAFYLLLDWDHMVARLDEWAPRDHVGTLRRLARDMDRVLAGFVRGQLTVCAILGTFYAVGLSAAGLDFGLMIGVFAGLISFIPFVGSILGGAMALGVAVFQFWDAPEMIAVVAGVFVLGQAIEGNVLTPKLVGGSVGLHPVALMFALSAFGALMGFTGLLIAVPAAAAIGVLARFAIEQYKAGRLYLGRAALAQGAPERALDIAEDELRAAAERLARAAALAAMAGAQAGAQSGAGGGGAESGAGAGGGAEGTPRAGQPARPGQARKGAPGADDAEPEA